MSRIELLKAGLVGAPTLEQEPAPLEAEKKKVKFVDTTDELD